MLQGVQVCLSFIGFGFVEDNIGLIIDGVFLGGFDICLFKDIVGDFKFCFFYVEVCNMYYSFGE